MRQVKPEFFTDAKLLKLSPLHRLLFEGLWCWADREGRLEDKPDDLKIRILPADTCDVDSMLADLASVGIITRYEARDGRYLSVGKFKKHQHVHIKEAASTIPAPCLNGVGTGFTRGLPGKASASTSESTSASVSTSKDLLPAKSRVQPLRKEKETNPALKALQDSMAGIFSEVTGEKYGHRGAKDTEALKRLMSFALTPEILRRWHWSLNEKGFVRCATYTELADKWNHYSGMEPGDEAKKPAGVDATGGIIRSSTYR